MSKQFQNHQNDLDERLIFGNAKQLDSVVELALVSICIPTYNGEKFIIETLNSAFSQTYPNLEIILSDDDSSDATIEIAETFQKKYPVNFSIIKHERYGLVENWNYCISQSKGKYIKFLFQDDLLEPGCIEEMVKLAEQDNEIGLVYSPRNILLSENASSDPLCMKIYSACRDLHTAWSNLKAIQSGSDLLADPSLLKSPLNKVGEPSTVLIKKEIFDKIGFFDTNLHQVVDVDMWLRIMGCCKIGFINQTLSSFRIHENQQTKNNIISGEIDKDEPRLYRKILCDSSYSFIPNTVKEQILHRLTIISRLQHIQPQVEETLVKIVEFLTIKPIAKDIDRPIWSVVIPTYNNTKYLEQTLRSVLEQAPDPEVMQIEVVDDCSTEGDVEEIVKRVGKGRINFYRNSQNLGLIGNWNACIERAQGHWVHILHQDDLVMPGFYAKLQAGIEQQPGIGAAFCRHLFINDEGGKLAESYLERQTPGIIENWLKRIAGEQLIQCPSIVVKRSVYEELGGYCPQAGYAADWEMWKRIAARYPFWFEPETLAAYRWHPLSATSKYIASGANIADTRRTIEISESYLPKNVVVEASRRAREHYALHAFDTAQQMLQLGYLDVAVTQIQEGLKCSESSKVMSSLATLLINSEYLLRVFASLFVFTKKEHIFAYIHRIIEQEQLTLDLRDINLILFPDWQQPEELLYEQLGSIIKNIITHPEADKIMVLLDNTGISEEDVNFVISDIVFNLLQEDLDITEEPAISLTGDLTEKQWQTLLSQITARIPLNIDNKAAIFEAQAESVPICYLENISNISTASLDSTNQNSTVKSSQGFNIVTSLGSKPRIDVVLQSNGLHGWSCSRGWANVLQQEGLLNRVFTPIADWNTNEPKHDSGLFEYLKNPQADIMLLLGFDWHSQPLHNSLKWQEQWNKASITKLAVIQECYSSKLVKNTPQWQQLLSDAISSTVPCVDGLICHHEPDVEFLQLQKNISLPIIFQPFGIDPEMFRVKEPFNSRLNKAVFRGNIAAFFTKDTYSERRLLLESLTQCLNVDIFEFDFKNLVNPIAEVERYVNELNAYRLALNLPSMSPTLTARPFEVMACGGVLLQNQVIGEKSNKFFKDFDNVVYYDPENSEDLISKIEYLIKNPDVAEQIAIQGQQLCYSQHTIYNRVVNILNWLDYSLEEKTSSIQNIMASIC